eukprot:SAG31_NODE_23912_length_493_cov_0.527919_2_plen_102_part_01
MVRHSIDHSHGWHGNQHSLQHHLLKLTTSAARRAYGVPSDPQKVSRIRVINRAFAALDNATAGGIVTALADDPVLRNATRFALKLTEHTCASKSVRFRCECF